jgi:O-succinylbenzoic acid--CoA ligase
VTRELRMLPADDPRAVFAALRDALTGDGPAVLPRQAGAVDAAATSEAVSATSSVPLPVEVPRNVALVIETSGSTGVPKRVALSTDALLASAAASASALGGAGQWLLALPAHYVAGAQVLVRSIAAETEPAILPAGHFDPARFGALAATMTGEARFVSLVPAQLARLIEAGDDAPALLALLRRFDGILVGGQSLPAGLRNRATELGLRIVTTYGSSETSGGCVYDGIPIGNTRARAVDGRLELAGAVLAEGYLGDPQRTADAFHDDDGLRWYRTGDLGTVEDGRVTVIGRADNVIISGGEKVLLDAVEAAVRECAGFEEAVVVVVESAEWGQVPAVAVAGARPARTSLDDLREYVVRRLGRAAAPARIQTLDALPMLPSGKPDRVAIGRLLA